MDAIRVVQGQPEIAMRICQDGAYVELLFGFVNTDFIEIGKTRIFEIPKVHSIVDVPEGIHVSPDDVLAQNYRVFFDVVQFHYDPIDPFINRPAQKPLLYLKSSSGSRLRSFWFESEAQFDSIISVRSQIKPAVSRDSELAVAQPHQSPSSLFIYLKPDQHQSTG
jgi:hypothetical protein